MRPSTPRIVPVAPHTFTDEQSEVAGEHARYNFARVMVQHPQLYKSFIPFAEQLLRRSRLPVRDREILLLRTLALCREAYEAPHHVLMARHGGLTEAEIAAAQTGTGTLSEFDQALIRAAEELVRNQRLGRPTWHILAQRYTQTQLMEVVFLVGAYAMSSMATNSFGIPVDTGAEHP